MSIQTRLILVLTSLALALVLGIVLLFQWRFDVGLDDYLNAQQALRLEMLADDLAERWREDPGWRQLREEQRRFYRLARHLPEHDAHDDGEPAGPDSRPPPSAPPPLPVLLLDHNHALLIGYARTGDPLVMEFPIVVDGVTVGYVATPHLAQLENEVDRHFRAEQLHSLWGVAAFSLLIAVVFAVLLARQFTLPLRHLSFAAHRLTQQHYRIDVDERRRDEFGKLARDMSALAKTLARNADARQRWFADISHELRTPLAVLIGEIDALVDGVRPLTTERIASLQQEALHLQRLVEDLYVLARADMGVLEYHKADLDFGELVRERVDAMRNTFAAAGLAVTVKMPAPGTPPVLVHGDEHRLQQLIDNLLANSARYTASGGQVQVSLTLYPRDILLGIEDSAPGVPEAALPRLFEHLYRVDDARTRSAGGAGLGLAICQRIVEAHEGSIGAAHSALGGLRIGVSLPRALPAGAPAAGEAA